jgi:hypothetical protein
MAWRYDTLRTYTALNGGQAQGGGNALLVFKWPR